MRTCLRWEPQRRPGRKDICREVSQRKWRVPRRVHGPQCQTWGTGPLRQSWGGGHRAWDVVPGRPERGGLMVQMRGGGGLGTSSGEETERGCRSSEQRCPCWRAGAPPCWVSDVAMTCVCAKGASMPGPPAFPPIGLLFPLQFKKMKVYFTYDEIHPFCIYSSKNFDKWIRCVTTSTIKVQESSVTPEKSPCHL